MCMSMCMCMYIYIYIYIYMYDCMTYICPCMYIPRLNIFDAYDQDRSFDQPSLDLGKLGR